jgi:hypothetical protein
MYFTLSDRFRHSTNIWIFYTRREIFKCDKAAHDSVRKLSKPFSCVKRSAFNLLISNTSCLRSFKLAGESSGTSVAWQVVIQVCSSQVKKSLTDSYFTLYLKQSFQYTWNELETWFTLLCTFVLSSSDLIWSRFVELSEAYGRTDTQTINRSDWEPKLCIGCAEFII